MPVKIFFCYAHEDSTYLHKLKKHLTPLQRENLISTWHDVNISPGAEWEREIAKHLNEAQIILLLVSSDFMASDYCYSIEMQRAMERHEQGEARVIPIYLRPTDWKRAPFGKLQALPTDAKPVTDPSWVTRDRAFITVVENVRKVIEDLLIHSPVAQLVPSKTTPEWEREKPVLQSSSSLHEASGNWLTYCSYCGASIRFRAESGQGTVYCPGCRRSQQYQIGSDWGRGDFEIKVEGSDAREVQEVSLALIEQAKLFPIPPASIVYLCYCSTCKKKTEMKDTQETTTKNGNPAVKGHCSVCDTNVYLVLRAKKNSKD